MLGLFGPKSGKIGVYKAAFIYQEPFKEDFSAGSPAINEVVLGIRVNKPLINAPEPSGWHHGWCRPVGKR